MNADELAEIARSVQRFCELHGESACASEHAGEFPRAAWAGLADLGVLGLLEVSAIAAAMRELGRAGFPGPLVGTFVAARLLGDDDRAGLAQGEQVVAVGAPPLMAWAPFADRWVVIESGRAWLAQATAPIEPVGTLGGEAWGRVAVERTRDLGDAAIASAVGDVALAAYVEGSGSQLVTVAVEHARTRKQFGRAIGEFQAVSHPLANVAVRLRAANALVLAAAHALDDNAADAASLAAAARISATRAALEAATVAPQIFGALGVLVEGPVFALARRIRQFASLRDEHLRACQAVLAPLQQKEHL